VARYPVEVDSGFRCGLYNGGGCDFQSVPKIPPTLRTAALPRVNEQEVAAYPKIIGSQNMMPLYQHTSDHFVLEAAKQLLQAGSTSFKFDLKNMKRDGKVVGYIKGEGPLAILTNRELPYLQLLDMPFKHFMIWTAQLGGPPTFKGDVDGWDVYKEIYRLTQFILKRYNGSGKTFYIGQWEGDWSIRDVLNKDANANPKRVQQMVKLLSDKQRGVDDAKRATGHKDVWVWHYAEANLVENSIKKGTSWTSMVHGVIDKVRPVIDYVSVSVGGDSLREWNPTNNLHVTMDYARSRLPFKSGVPEPRAFVGEFYFSIKYPDGKASQTAPTPEMQKQRALWAAASGIAWGSEHMMWWQFQENEMTKDGQYRGFWLVDNNNKPTPLYQSLQQFYKDAEDFVRSTLAATGKLPTRYAYRRWAVYRLIELSGKTDTSVWKPYVRAN